MSAIAGYETSTLHGHDSNLKHNVVCGEEVARWHNVIQLRGLHKQERVRNYSGLLLLVPQNILRTILITYG
jgi:hypothetical protein